MCRRPEVVLGVFAACADAATRRRRPRRLRIVVRGRCYAASVRRPSESRDRRRFLRLSVRCHCVAVTMLAAVVLAVIAVVVLAVVMLCRQRHSLASHPHLRTRQALAV